LADGDARGTLHKGLRKESPSADSYELEAPGITRRHRPRRPFLAPLWVIILLVFGAVGLAVLFTRFAGTTMVVLVHPTRGSDDLPLTEQGQQRAQSLALMFAGPQGVAGSLDALYVADTRSARDTMAPLAGRLGRQPVPVPAANAGRVAARMLREHSGRTMLLVARSDQVPALVRELSGAEVPSGEDDVGYILSIPTVGEASVLRFRY
jgi:hypothetical protein